MLLKMRLYRAGVAKNNVRDLLSVFRPRANVGPLVGTGPAPQKSCFECARWNRTFKIRDFSSILQLQSTMIPAKIR